MIDTSAPDAAALFRSALDEELAVGFPVDWPGIDGNGLTLLYCTVNSERRIKAGLPQILIEAGVDVNIPEQRRYHAARPLLLGLCRPKITGIPECYKRAACGSADRWPTERRLH